MSGRRKFTLDKANGKFMGVCAGISNFTGVDATFVRIAAVMLTLAFHWVIIAYFAAAFIARPKCGRSDAMDRHGAGRLSTHDVRTRMSDIDRRMAEVDSFVTHSNTRLAREIEELR